MFFKKKAVTYVYCLECSKEKTPGRFTRFLNALAHVAHGGCMKEFSMVSKMLANESRNKVIAVIIVRLNPGRLQIQAFK